MWWGEERGGIARAVEQLTEDYGENGGDYQDPRSAYENETDYVAEEFNVDYEKGTPVLYVD